VLDHYGFDVKDHAAFVKKIEAEGIKLDEPPRHIAGRPTLQPFIRQCFEYTKQHAGVWFARRRDIVGGRQYRPRAMRTRSGVTLTS
jgi:hypothetical protein